MNSSSTFTIGIPTFNRADAVSRRVQEILALDLGDHVDVLVIDNDSTDGTFERLTAQFTGPGVRVLKNESNIGYAGNLLRLIDEIESDYVVFLSDEDRINAEGVEALIRFCRENQPDMVSPRAHVRGDSSYRGRGRTAEIMSKDFESASFYISGLTFSSKKIKLYASTVRALVPENSAANVYPQVLLAALSIAGGKCFFLEALVSTQVEELDTHIVEHSGGTYYSLQARWEQFVGYEEFFDADHSKLVGTAGARNLEQMRDEKRQTLLKVLHGTAVAEIPALTPYFMRSHLRFALDGLKRRLLRR